MATANIHKARATHPHDTWKDFEVRKSDRKGEVEFAGGMVKEGGGRRVTEHRDVLGLVVVCERDRVWIASVVCLGKKPCCWYSL